MGTATSLTTLCAEMEAQYASGAASVSLLKKEKEAKFQEKLNKG